MVERSHPAGCWIIFIRVATRCRFENGVLTGRHPEAQPQNGETTPHFLLVCTEMSQCAEAVLTSISVAVSVLQPTVEERYNWSIGESRRRHHCVFDGAAFAESRLSTQNHSNGLLNFSVADRAVGPKLLSPRSNQGPATSRILRNKPNLVRAPALFGGQNNSPCATRFCWSVRNIRQGAMVLNELLTVVS